MIFLLTIDMPAALIVAVMARRIESQWQSIFTLNKSK